MVRVFLNALIFPSGNPLSYRLSSLSSNPILISSKGYGEPKVKEVLIMLKMPIAAASQTHTAMELNRPSDPMV